MEQLANAEHIPPTSWNNKLEKVMFMRTLSFSEYEMISNPLLMLNVVATSEYDPVASMQELLSSNYIPTTFNSVCNHNNYFF